MPVRSGHNNITAHNMCNSPVLFSPAQPSPINNMCQRVSFGGFRTPHMHTRVRALTHMNTACLLACLLTWMKILTELVFENVLSSLEPEEIAAVLSALIFQVQVGCTWWW